MKTLLALLVFAGAASAGYVTNAQISGFGTTTITGTATIDPQFDLVPFPPSASVHAGASAFTLGPVRAGFLEISGDGFANTGSQASAMVGSQSSVCQELCFPVMNGTPIAFTLGVPFQIQANASVNTLGSPANPVPGVAGIMFQFSLFESVNVGGTLPPIPGAKVTIFQAAPSVPEPSMWAVVGLGLLGIVRLGTIHRGSSDA